MPVIKITQKLNFIDQIESFTIMGDPGCDGLGAGIMSTFAKALTAARSDLAVILGDLVATDREDLYRTISGFIDTVSPVPTYALCGNHDDVFYERYFGLKDYLLIGPSLLLIVLDNSKRTFSPATLAFLKDSLDRYERPNILVLFHLPPPNQYAANSLSREEWAKAAVLLEPHRTRIKYLVCGHVHSFFEDVVDGFRLIVSAGAGARLEHVSDRLDPLKTFHHVLRFSFAADGELSYEHLTLDGKKYEHELRDPKIREALALCFEKASQAYIRNYIFALDAKEKGDERRAKLFRAIATGAYFQARNHFMQLNLLGKIADNLAASFETGQEEIEKFFPGYLDYARRHQLGLSAYSFFDALESKKTQGSLLQAGREEGGPAAGQAKYFVCSSCGFSLSAGEKPANCPICGAPFDKIIEIE